MRQISNGIELLLSAVLERTIADIIGEGPRGAKYETDYAMDFVHTDTCELICDRLGLCYELFKDRAVKLYQDFLKNEPIRKPYRRAERRARKPINRFKGVWTRQSPTKRRRITYL